MKSIAQLQEMTTREIALDAKHILGTHTYAEAKELLKNHIQIANEKMQAVAKKINKEFGSNRVPPQIKVISDFKRFK